MRYDDFDDLFEERPRRKGKAWGRVLAVLMALVLLGSVAVSVVWVMRNMAWTQTGEGLPFTLPPFFDGFPGAVEPGFQPTPAPMRPTGGGDATVEFASGGDVMSTADIAQQLIPSVVGVLSGSREEERSSSGTGIIMSSDGYIITNYHVVEGHSALAVVLHDGEELDALLVGGDRKSDLAVLKVDRNRLPAAPFGDSDSLRVGDRVIAIGNPLGLELQSTVTQGIISGISRDIVIEDRAMTMLQTDASVNPGNSGGPLINEYGQVIGIISSKIMGGYVSSVEGLGFAIPMTIAAPLIEELISEGFIRGRPSIGIMAVTLTPGDARAYGVPEGLRVVYVNPEADAHEKGLLTDDVITHINGLRVTSITELNAEKEKFSVGEEITLTVHRRGQALDVTFALMDEGELSS